jgi:hypothetical protein
MLAAKPQKVQKVKIAGQKLLGLDQIKAAGLPDQVWQ